MAGVTRLSREASIRRSRADDTQRCVRPLPPATRDSGSTPVPRLGRFKPTSPSLRLGKIAMQRASRMTTLGEAKTVQCTACHTHGHRNTNTGSELSQDPSGPQAEPPSSDFSHSPHKRA